MSRTDTHLDGMLRHLGAAYYDSLQGKATQADVDRAVDNVAAHLNELGRAHGTQRGVCRQAVGSARRAVTAASTAGPAGSAT